jgi:hypothetical protein
MIISPSIPKMKILWYTPVKLIKNLIVELLDAYDLSLPGEAGEGFRRSRISNNSGCYLPVKPLNIRLLQCVEPHSLASRKE